MNCATLQFDSEMALEVDRCIIYTIAKRVTLLLSFENLQYPQNISAMLKLVTKCWDNGTVKNKGRLVENPLRNEGIELVNFGHADTDPKR